MIVQTVVADDERLARSRIRRFLAQDDWIEIAAECQNGPETVRAVNRLKPDLLFLDIEMPGLRGIDLVERFRVRPLVVFVTAHPNFAADAFDLNALDYLRKPVPGDRFQETLARVRNALERLDQGPEAGRPRGDPSARIFVRRLGKIIPIATADLVHIEADRDYLRLHTVSGCEYVRTPLKSLEARLDPAHFMRVHRSSVVNLNHVSSFRGIPGSRLRAELSTGGSVEVSRRCAQQIRARGLC